MVRVDTRVGVYMNGLGGGDAVMRWCSSGDEGPSDESFAYRRRSFRTIKYTEVREIMDLAPLREDCSGMMGLHGIAPTHRESSGVH